MPTPTNYGWFHLLSIGLVVAATVLFCVFFRDTSDKRFRIILGICWVVIVLLEIYKQVIFSVNFEDGKAVWSYQWYAFPYQLCSTPLYALPLVVFLPQGKIRDAVMSFLSSFAFFGGLAVMIFPNDVFIGYIGINIQTMIHHGLQVVLGIFLAVYNRRKLGVKYWLSSLPVYGVAIAIAMILNLTIHQLVPDQTFNMFYISHYYDCTLPVLSVIDSMVPWAVLFIIYLFGFIIVSLIMFGAQFGIIKLCSRGKKRGSAAPTAEQSNEKDGELIDG